MTLRLLKNLQTTVWSHRIPSQIDFAPGWLQRKRRPLLGLAGLSAAMLMATSSANAQQFQSPRQFPGTRIQTEQAQVAQSQPPRFRSNPAQPVQQSRAARSVTIPDRARSSSASYAPPVHIIPARGDRQATPLHSHVETHSFSDSQSRMAPSSQSAARQQGRQEIRQTTMQQPIPESELPAGGTVNVAWQDAGFREPSRNYPPGKTQGRPVSVLTGRGGQADQGFQSETDESSQNNFSPQDFSLPSEPDRNQSGTSDLQPPQFPQQPNDSRMKLDSGDDDFQDDSSREKLEQRLDELMEETENDLRHDRPDSQGNRNGDSPRSLLEKSRGNGARSNKTLLDTTCDEFRQRLLDNPIRDIPLNMSPLVSDRGYGVAGLSRTWTDRSGNTLATGAMVDLKRGYVILDNGQRIAYGRMSEADLAAVSEYWRIPATCAVGNRGSVYRDWYPQTFTWTASSLCHKPLYFENVQLERYGHSHGPFSQPVHSVAHFFVSLVTVPYQSGIHPANECQYALGFYRPGDCAPWLVDPIPISLNGARRQALITTGLAFIP